MDLWNDDEPIGDRFEEQGLTVPDWIEKDISPADVAAIVQGGCAFGAYMPAVTYYDAAQTMGRHGDAVLDYLAEHMGGLTMPDPDTSWSGIAVHFLSSAVELWATSTASILEDIDDPDEAV